MEERNWSLRPPMSIAVVNNDCSRRLHVDKFRGKRYFGKEVEVFHSILLKFFFLQMCITYSPSIIHFWSFWRSSFSFISMMGGDELPERRSKQQNGLKNFKHHSWFIALYKRRGYLKCWVNTHYSTFQRVMSGADVCKLHSGLRYLRENNESPLWHTKRKYFTFQLAT